MVPQISPSAGSGAESSRARWQVADALHDGSHLAGRGFAETEFWLIGRHRLSGRNVDLLVEHGLVQAGFAQRFVDVAQAESVDGHVGGGVVAENDHQPEDVAKSESDGRREFAEHAGTLDLIGFGENDALVQRGVAGANLFSGIEKDAHLDDGGGLHRLVGDEGCGLAGEQVVRIDSDMAVMSCSDGFDLLIELRIFARCGLSDGRLGACGGRSAGEHKDQSHG